MEVHGVGGVGIKAGGLVTGRIGGNIIRIRARAGDEIEMKIFLIRRVIRPVPGDGGGRINSGRSYARRGSIGIDRT